MIEKLVSFIKRKVLRDSRERWNHQFEKGRWDNLRDPVELERIELVANLVKKYTRQQPRVLEMGSGEGFFRQLFQPNDFSEFIGSDLADVAIERANKQFGDAKTRFYAVDMNDFAPEGRFDAIVVNEAIYYANDVAALIRRFARHHLNEGGIFIITVHKKYKHEAELWENILSVTQEIDAAHISNEWSRWDIKVLKPKV
jgi:SAM-dependent methyltransferase